MIDIINYSFQDKKVDRHGNIDIDYENVDIDKAKNIIVNTSWSEQQTEVKKIAKRSIHDITRKIILLKLKTDEILTITSWDKGIYVLSYFHKRKEVIGSQKLKLEEVFICLTFFFENKIVELKKNIKSKNIQSRDIGKNQQIVNKLLIREHLLFRVGLMLKISLLPLSLVILFYIISGNLNFFLIMPIMYIFWLSFSLILTLFWKKNIIILGNTV